MARPTKSDRWQAVHDTALAEFNRAQSAVLPVREICVADRRFYSIEGAQWEGVWADQFQNRVMLEVNKTHAAVMRVVNSYRSNRITVDFVPKDGDKDDMAEVCDGLYRADEQDSHSQEAMDNAFEEGIGGGFGAWRLRNCYEDEYDPENEKQRIKIEPIFDADTCVFFDPNSQLQDKSDAKFCFVLYGMTPQAYKEEWGDDPETWPKAVQSPQENSWKWATPDLVYVAEYFRIEEKTVARSHYRLLDGTEEVYSEEELDDDLIETLAGRGAVIERTRKIKARKVHKWIMSGGGILEDCGYIAGPNIPIVPFFGKRWFVEGMEYCAGVVRYLKDPQRLGNMQRSRLAEIAAMSPNEVPIFTPEQIAGHEERWARGAVDNPAYQLVNPMVQPDGSAVPSGPVGYTKPPAVPPAMAALLQVTEQDMIDIMGNPQAGEDVQPQMSGVAVELVQNRIDQQSFIYMDNMRKAVQRCGEIWLGMAREVYVEEGRKMKSIGVDNAPSSVEINRLVLKDGATEYENDMTKANFDVWVEVGPTSTSRRASIVRSLVGMMQVTADPASQAVLGAAALMNMEGEGLQDIRQWSRRNLVAQGVVRPTEQEREEMQAAAQTAQPDPQAVLANAMAAEANAKAIRAESETEKNIAQAQSAKADAVATLAKIGQDDRKAAVDAAKALSGIIQNTQPPSGQMGEMTATQPPSDMR